MTSEQTDALRDWKDAAAAFLARSVAFGHAFGQDNPEIAAAVESTAEAVGETAHTVAAWSANR